MAKVAIQGGVKNYLPSEEITIPKKAKSSKNHPTTELAYITEAEKNLLLKKDLHNSLNGKPNKGPGGIISLNGEFDGGPDRSPGNTGSTPSTGGGGNNFRDNAQHTYRATVSPAQVKATQAKQEAIIRDAKEAAIIKNFKATQYPMYLPGGTAASFARNVFGTPFTKAGKKRTANRRMDYINSLDPRSRKAMIDRLGLAEDEDYEENEVQYGNVSTLTGDPLAMGKNIYGMDAYDVINYDGKFLEKYGQKPMKDNDSNQPYIPINYNMGSGESKDVAVENEYDYHLGLGGQGIGRDVTLGYLADGGRAGKAEGGIMGTRARRAMGGIMGRVDQRQGYFLGKIVKGVKSAVSGVVDATKKVLKSDVGKLALAGLGTYYMSGGMGLGGAKMFGNTASSTFMGNLGRVGTLIKDNPFKSIGIASMALPFLAGGAKPNEDNFSDRGGRLIDPLTGEQATPSQMRASIETAKEEAAGDPVKLSAIDAKYNNMLNLNLPSSRPYPLYGAANGGRIGKAEGGLMDLGGMEKDYRSEGGFVPIGEYEKKDDVPARLSVNEFVFTADAVRGAGQGDIDKGAEIMENMMKNLENGGTVSEESQGNKGAQQMFETSERLGAVI